MVFRTSNSDPGVSFSGVFSRLVRGMRVEDAERCTRSEASVASVRLSQERRLRSDDKRWEEVTTIRHAKKEEVVGGEQRKRQKSHRS